MWLRIEAYFIRLILTFGWKFFVYFDQFKSLKSVMIHSSNNDYEKKKWYV